MSIKATFSTAAIAGIFFASSANASLELDTTHLKRAEDLVALIRPEVSTYYGLKKNAGDSYEKGKIGIGVKDCLLAIDINLIREAQIKVISDVLTNDEIDVATSFYRSTTGQKYLATVDAYLAQLPDANAPPPSDPPLTKEDKIRVAAFAKTRAKVLLAPDSKEMQAARAKYIGPVIASWFQSCKATQ